MLIFIFLNEANPKEIKLKSSIITLFNLFNKDFSIKYLFLAFCAIFAFFELMIVFGGFDLMGVFGKRFWQINFKFFGIFAYLYPLILVYFGYLLYQKKGTRLRRVEVGLSSTLFFLLLLILQYASLHYGAIGEAIVGVLKPYLGIFGIVSTSLLLSAFCLLSLRDEDIFTYLKKINLSKTKTYISNSLQTFKNKVALPLREYLHNRRTKALEEKISTPPIELDFIEEEVVEEVQTPQPLPPIQTKEETLSLPHKSPFENVGFREEDIKIQEYIVNQPQTQQSHNIKVVDKDEIPQVQKINPFSHEELLSLESKSISSSADILKKIRQESHKPQIPQTPSTPRSSTPSPTPSAPKELPKTLQSTPLHKPFKPTPAIEEESTLQEFEEFNESIQEEMIQEEIMQEENTQVWQEGLATQEKFEEEEIEESEEYLDEIEEEEESAPFISQAPQNTPSQTSIPNQAPSQTPPIQSAPKRYSSAFELSPQNSQVRTSKVSSLAENEALLSEIDKGELEAPKDYALPPLSLLSPAPQQESTELDDGEIDEKIGSLLEKLAVFKIDGDVTRIYSGPIITTLEFRPAPNVKVSRIQSLENDIAMALEAKSIRIQAPIPGKNVVGIEIPNTNIQTIYLREIFESEIFKNSSSPLTLALGKDVVGNPFVTDLKKLPHLLIAGTTGSGKSVGVNAMILSLLYRNSPDDLKLMMVDPKMVEFMPYTDLPHLITPIITDPKKAVIGLANAVREMERRYTLMSQSRTKEIVSYNQKAQELGLEKFPYFVIIIDELADLMMTAGKEVEYSMARIAQMGRASGMHLIVATQSPRAEVLTGLIKTNLPAHLSYKVGTKIDASIIGCPGAETLLGRGDMLFTPPGVSGLVRLHAPWSSEDEVNEIVSYIKDQREVMYNPLFSPEEKESLGAMDSEELDSESAELLDRAKEIILRDRKTSTSYVQRRLGIGYNKAANIMEKLEQMGFVSPANSKGAREILG